MSTPIGETFVQLGISMRAFSEAIGRAGRLMSIAMAPLTKSRTRIRCRCGANPRAVDWQRHTWPIALHRRPWRAGREHSPL